MKRKDRYTACIKYFSSTYPNAQTELHYSSPFQLLVAVILSAQCTDKRVNAISPNLFTKFPDAAAMAASNANDIFNAIKSISYPQSKSRYLHETSQRLITHFNGEVPVHMEELIQLPGVGRKTANVILSVLHGKAAMAVDTHVFRVSKRIGLVKTGASLLQTERELITNLPEALVHRAHHWLILHGRYVCMARKPKCSSCGISALCNFYIKNSTSAKLNTNHNIS